MIRGIFDINNKGGALVGVLGKDATSINASNILIEETILTITLTSANSIVGNTNGGAITISDCYYNNTKVYKNLTEEVTILQGVELITLDQNWFDNSNFDKTFFKLVSNIVVSI